MTENELLTQESKYTKWQEMKKRIYEIIPWEPRNNLVACQSWKIQSVSGQAPKRQRENLCEALSILKTFKQGRIRQESFENL